MRKNKFSLDFILTWVFVPVLLLLFWIGFSLFFTSKYSLTVLAIPHIKQHFTSYKTTELLKGQKLRANFYAQENNLGIVSVRFFNFQRISDDRVIFRIKEKQQREWFYEHAYKVDQFQSDELFTFGFPIINNSKGNEYTFEIESVQGRKGNAIALSEVYPPFVTQYQFDKTALLANKSSIIPFTISKLYYLFTDRNLFIASLIYLLPLIFYVLLTWHVGLILSIAWKYYPYLRIRNSKSMIMRGKNAYILVHIYLIMIVLLIFFMDQTNSYVQILLIALWIWLIKIYKFESNVSYFLSLIFLLLCPLMIFTGYEMIAQRSAIWAYFFLVMGTGVAIGEVSGKWKTVVNYQLFVQQNIESVKNFVRVKRK